MMRRRSIFERAYRSALLIFPPPFREEFEDEMVDFARYRVRRRAERGIGACASESARSFAESR